MSDKTIGTISVKLKVDSYRVKEGFDRIVKALESYNIKEEHIKEISDSLEYMIAPSCKDLRDKKGSKLK